MTPKRGDRVRCGDRAGVVRSVLALRIGEGVQPVYVVRPDDGGAPIMALAADFTPA